jgi:hypothetical protein
MHADRNGPYQCTIDADSPAWRPQPEHCTSQSAGRLYTASDRSEDVRTQVYKCKERATFDHISATNQEFFSSLHLPRIKHTTPRLKDIYHEILSPRREYHRWVRIFHAR